ncbi:MAG: DUF5711 family protein [Clostridia bacterium]|nr:DUF5711 family protein [Clostridia bacterium]
MEFPEKEPSTGQAGSKIGAVSFFLLLLVVVTIAFAVYLKSKNENIGDLSIKELISTVFSDKGGKSAVEKLIGQIEYDYKEHPVYSIYKDSIIKCTKDNVMCLNKKGEVLWSKSIQISNPLIKVGDSYLLIADLNGRYFYVINGKEIKWEQKVDSNIINADINEKGYVAIVKEYRGYKGAVEVYDPHGNWIFTSTKGENHILSAKVLPSCDGVAVNTLDTSGVSADTQFEFISMAGKVTGKLKEINAIFPFIWPMNNNSIVAVGDSAAVCIDEEKKIKWRLQFDKVYSSNSSLGKLIVIAAKGNGSSGMFSGEKTEVKIINTAGESAKEFSVDGDVYGIETYGSTIAVNSGREIYFANTKGKLIGKYSSKIDILEVQFFNKDEVAVISKNNIVVTRIN